ncbi:MAG: hypothetical protein HQ518_27450 [Rhodopirellula sp.]|nr:hypothetical protein [Rhodopirellula sp.]
MFQDQREFRCIAVKLPSARSLNEVTKWLPDGRLSEKWTPIETASQKFDVIHATWISTLNCAPSQDLSEIIEERDGHKMYRYSVYLMMLRNGRSATFFFAAPFSQILREMCVELHEATAGKKRLYETLDLDVLLQRIKDSSDSEAKLTATFVRYEVHGDSTLDGMTVRGSDTVNSKTQRRLESSLRGIELVPSRAKIVYSGEGGSRFSIEADGNGNYRFRVRREAKNLPWFQSLWESFIESNVVKSQSVFPMKFQSNGDDASD